MHIVKHRKISLRILFILVAACAWYVFGTGFQALSNVVKYAPGIDLVYLPAGIRLALILLFRVWGAIGISISNPLLFIGEFGERSPYEIGINSLICGFVPFLSIKIASYFLSVGDNLENLGPIQLTMLSFIVSVTTPLAFNIKFLAFDLKPPEVFLGNLTAMMMGDFIGCLLVLIIARSAIALYIYIIRR